MRPRILGDEIKPLAAHTLVSDDQAAAARRIIKKHLTARPERDQALAILGLDT